MGFFSTKKSKPKLMPLYDFQKTGTAYQTDLLNQGTPNIPTAPVVGMTGTEKAGQSLLSQVANGGGYYGTGMDKVMDIVNGNYDPRTSDYYKGLRAEAADLNSQGAAAINRRSQMGWGGPSRGTTTRAVGDFTRQTNNDLLTQLGGMYETERNRMQDLIPTLLNGDQGILQMISQYGSLPRAIDQAKADAKYKQQYDTTMFPYTTLNQIAASLAGNQGNGTYMTQPQPSTFSQILDYGSQIGKFAGMFA